MDRIKLIQFIYERLAQLEKEKEYCNTSLHADRYSAICAKMDHLRVTLQNAMNSNCPIIFDKE